MARRATTASELRQGPSAATSTAELRAAGLSTAEIRLVKARSPLAWLRPVLLALGLLVIGAVVLMLLAYRFGRGAAAEDSLAARPATVTDGQVLAGQGFDYTQTSEGVPVFRIRADESEQDRSGNSYLTRVILDVFHQDGKIYTVESAHAWVNENTWEARLEGDVKLTGWDDFELRARALKLRHGGQVLESVGEVELRYPPELEGRASQLKVDRGSDLITLSEGVHLRTVPGAERPMRLDCQRLVYQRAGGILRAVGEASLRTESQSLAAHYLTIFLEADGRTLESVRARWNVVGRLTLDSGLGDRTEVEYHGEFLDLQPDAQDPGSQRIKLDGEGEEVSLAVTDLSGLRRVFTGLYLVGHARDDRLIQIEGVGDPLTLVEALDLDPPFVLRQLCAERATARFLPDGGVARVQLENRVELSDPELSMSGGRKASLNAESGSFQVEGPEVLFISRRGEATARQFSWTRGSGVIRARGEVRALLAESSARALRGTPLGGAGRGPVQVEAKEAFWTAEPPTFTFEGEVRAWRGQSLLLADQLRGEEREQKLAASGGVRTVWVPETAEPFREPIEVSAEHVSFLDGESRLVYDQNVEMRQGRRTIQCQELGVELGPAGQAERMTCETDVSMTDPDTGRRVQGGDRAVYNLAEKLLEIFGEKVEIYDADNNRLQGRYVRYDLRDGTFKVRSRAQGAGAGAP